MVWKPMQTCAFPGCKNKIPEYSLVSVCGATHIFLGGACGNNTWRDELILRLVNRGIPRQYLFNPVVAGVWNSKAAAEEDFAKSVADHCLFYVADPKQDDNRISTYSLVEAIMGLYDNPDRTLIAFDVTGMPRHAVQVVTKTSANLQRRFPHVNVAMSMEDIETILFDLLMWLIPNPKPDSEATPSV